MSDKNIKILDMTIRCLLDLINKSNDTIDDIEELSLTDEHYALKIKFKKADGSLRTMFCINDLKRIPKANHPKGSGKERTVGVIAVWDLEKKGWRNFKVDTIKDLKVVNYEKD